MSKTFTISEVADRTGFTASALRFYEQEGLITPGRSPSGYRVFDERGVDRLRFISRAKQLGLTLEEITELVGLWDGDQCGPVAHRLRVLVADKLDESRERIAELTAFADELQTVQGRLQTDPSDGPCSADCICQPAEASRSTTPVTLTSKATTSPSDAVAIACTLSSNGMTARMDEWRALLSQQTGVVSSEPGRRTVRFPSGSALAGRIAALAAAEQDCCSFFIFSLTLTSAGTDLTVSAPPDAQPLLDDMFGVAA